jgi:hypothetical protein
MSDSIFVDVEGARIEGRVVHRSQRDILISIVFPYRGLTTGLHIAAFAPVPPEHDFSGRHGDETSAGLLTGLYRLGKFIDENKESLRKKAAEMDSAIERLAPEQFLPHDHIQEIGRDLRKQLRQGLLDNKCYQQRLVQARKKVKARQSEIWHLEERFFTANFPMIVPVGTREEVLALLRSPA